MDSFIPCFVNLVMKIIQSQIPWTMSCTSRLNVRILQKLMEENKLRYWSKDEKHLHFHPCSSRFYPTRLQSRLHPIFDNSLKRSTTLSDLSSNCSPSDLRSLQSSAIWLSSISQSWSLLLSWSAPSLLSQIVLWFSRMWASYDSICSHSLRRAWARISLYACSVAIFAFIFAIVTREDWVTVDPVRISWCLHWWGYTYRLLRGLCRLFWRRVRCWSWYQPRLIRCQPRLICCQPRLICCPYSRYQTRLISW